MPTTISWTDLRGRRVGVWGLGVEGRASVRRLHELGVEPVLVDDRPAEPGVLPTEGAGLTELRRCDVVVKAPGISRYRDEVVALEAAGVVVVGGLGLWLAEVVGQRVVAITGTKGKSTTTSIVAKLAEGLGNRVFAGGNLGAPPYDPDLKLEVDPDVWVIETSSYQAADVRVSPAVTAVTSLHPDHLPWHRGSVEQYYRDKLSLCTHLGAVITVANGDSALVRERQTLLAPRVRWVSAEDDPSARWMDPLGLLGTHNRRNALIARACLEELGIVADDKHLERAAIGFVALPSRLTPVERIEGVDFVDDGLSTNVLATLAAVDSFPGRPLALLVGGADRGIDYGPLATELSSRPWPTLVEVMASESATPITDAFHAVPTGPGIELRTAPDIAAATFDAYEWARPAGVVLLSPAASSFDRFVDYRDRGAAFARAVRGCRTR